MLYTIYHPVKGMNHACLPFQEYKQVATVLAHNYEEAFKLAQNDFSETYQAFNIRSTGVGDIIRHGDDCFLVHGLGFKNVPLTWVTYKPAQMDETFVENLTLDIPEDEHLPYWEDDNDHQEDNWGSDAKNIIG